MMKLIFAGLAPLILVGCWATNANTLAASGLAPADAYTCVLRELAKRDYVVTTAEREAGMIRSEKKASGAATALLSNTTYYDEIHALVLPGESSRSSIKLTVYRTADRGRGERNQGGIRVPGSLKDDANAIQTTCK